MDDEDERGGRVWARHALHSTKHMSDPSSYIVSSPSITYIYELSLIPAYG